MHVKRVTAAILAAALVLPGMASALTFAGDWSAGANSAGPGLKVNLSQAAGGFATPDLAVGDSYSFDLFRIWTPDNSVDAGDDIVPQPISVAFGLTAPGAGNAMVTGSTVGLRGPIFGQPQAGELAWDGPATLSFGKGSTGKLTLALSGGIFNPLLSGLTNTAHFGRDVTATLTYDVAPVPLPAAAWLLMGGIGVLGAASRRRRDA